jgi:hypothetical protein
MVGEAVNVGEGTVGVNVGARVGVFVNVGAGVNVGCLPRISSIVIEQAESNNTTNRKTGIFFMTKQILGSHAGRE